MSRELAEKVEVLGKSPEQSGTVLGAAHRLFVNLKGLLTRRARFAAQQTFEYMRLLPQVSVPLIAKELKMTAPTARRALESMVELGILEEASGKKRDKVYIYRKYMDVLEDGAEPFEDGS